MSKSSMFPPSAFYGSNNHLMVRGIFREWTTNKDTAIFTLQRESVDGCVVLRDLYLQFCVSDASEATFAETVFGDVLIWETIKEANFFRPHYEEWLKTATIKRKQAAFKALYKEVEEGGRSSFSAAKYLIEEPWKDKRKKAVAKEVKETTKKAHDEVSEDVIRLREQGYLND